MGEDSLVSYRNSVNADRAARLIAAANEWIDEDQRRLPIGSALLVAAESAALESGQQWRKELTPERGAAHRAYLERPDVDRGEVTDPLDNIPAFLRA